MTNIMQFINAIKALIKASSMGFNLLVKESGKLKVWNNPLTKSIASRIEIIFFGSASIGWLLLTCAWLVFITYHFGPFEPVGIKHISGYALDASLVKKINIVSVNVFAFLGLTTAGLIKRANRQDKTSFYTTRKYLKK